MENAYDSFAESLAYVEKAGADPTRWKFAVLNLVHAVELVLKQRLVQEHDLLIWQDIDRPGRLTVGPEKAIQRLLTARVAMDEADVQAIHTAIRWRNNITRHVARSRASTRPRRARNLFGLRLGEGGSQLMWQGSYEFVVNQWGVGHGGLHSQSLTFQALHRDSTAPAGDGSSIRLIYDCGSGRRARPRRALRDAVIRMLADIPEDSNIDILVISHFDRDHVNGLTYLAEELDKRRIQVTRVWAPLLTNVEALFAIAASGAGGTAQSAYARLLADPEGRLSDLFQGAEITQFTANNERMPLLAAGSRADSEDSISGAVEIELSTAPDGRGLVASSTVHAQGEALWEFRPYVVESTLVGARTVSQRVRKLLGKPIEKCSLDDLIKMSATPSLLTEFHEAVRDHHAQLGLKSRRSSARTGANLSSLVVYSGPVAPYDWCRFRGGWGSLSATPWAIPIAPAWLGTGDAGLLRTEDVDAIGTVFTHNRLDRVGIVSAPHHGSKHDSGLPLWRALPNARWATIEANDRTGGTGNKHPHTEVLTALAMRELTVHASIDGSDFRWADKRIR